MLILGFNTLFVRSDVGAYTNHVLLQVGCFTYPGTNDIMWIGRWRNSQTGRAGQGQVLPHLYKIIVEKEEEVRRIMWTMSNYGINSIHLIMEQSKFLLGSPHIKHFVEWESCPFLTISAQKTLSSHRGRRIDKKVGYIASFRGSTTFHSTSENRIPDTPITYQIGKPINTIYNTMKGDSKHEHSIRVDIPSP